MLEETSRVPLIEDGDMRVKGNEALESHTFDGSMRSLNSLS